MAAPPQVPLTHVSKRRNHPSPLPPGVLGSGILRSGVIRLELTVGLHSQIASDVSPPNAELHWAGPGGQFVSMLHESLLSSAAETQLRPIDWQ